MTLKKVDILRIIISDSRLTKIIASGGLNVNSTQ